MKKKESFINICRDNLSLALKSLEIGRQQLSAKKSEIHSLDQKHSQIIKELNESMNDINSTIDQLVKHGSDVPSKLEEKKKSLVNQVTEINSLHEKSNQRKTLEAEINELIAKIENLEAQCDEWNNKTELASSIFGIKEAFYPAEYNSNKIFFEYVNLQERGLGIDSELVNVFDTIDDAIKLFLTSAGFEISLNDDGGINRIKINTVIGDKDIEISDIKNRYINLIPNELSWVDSIDNAQGFLAYAHAERVNFENFNTKLERRKNENILSVRFALDGYENKSHEEIFNNFRCYIVDQKAFFDINEQRFNLLPVEKIKIPIKRGHGRAYEIKFLESSELEEKTIPNSSQRLKPVTVDTSSLFKDFRGLISFDLEKSPIVRKNLDVILSALCFKENFFVETEQRLMTSEIEEEINIYWKAFINSPWDSSIPLSGPLRMLKHLCVRRIETPDICSLNYRGYYRFHVRTRDHTWIIGEIFCPPSALRRKTPIKSDEIIYFADGYREIVQVGDALIRIVGERR